MRSVHRFESTAISLFVALVVVVFLTAMHGFAAATMTSKPFAGAKVNGGTVTFSKEMGKRVLTLSDDFKVPDTPDPHWQVVDSKGRVYLLNKLKIKDDKFNKKIMLPAYIANVAKVQIWCAWAESLLGEADFAKPMK